MSKEVKLDLFISYSHADENYIDEFIKHITPLQKNDLINEWYDRKIIPGKEFEDDIFNNLENADIICLFISANFIASDACNKELDKAIELKDKYGVSVIPIILSECGWTDIDKLSAPLALPEDGKPVSNFDSRDQAWNNVYKGLKKVIQNEMNIRELSISDNFQKFLNETGLLTKAHSKKEEVFLNDIFVNPDLNKYDDLRELEKSINFESVLENFSEHKNILIAGEDQAGKTTLAKIFFTHLRKLNFIPIYLSEDGNQYLGKIENKISN